MKDWRKRVPAMLLAACMAAQVGTVTAFARGTDKVEWYYAQLGKDEKEIYKELLSSMRDYEEEAVVTFDKEVGKLKFERAFNAMSYEQPEKFWLDGWGIKGRVTTDSDGDEKYEYTAKPTISNGYGASTVNEERAKKVKNQAHAKAKEIVDSAHTLDAYKTLQVFNQWLIDNCAYDETSEGAASDKDSYTMVGALINGEAVCQGYAMAFKYLCDTEGIPCIFVPGKAYTAATGKYAPHAWNYVQIDDRWYLVDVTRNDTEGDSARYFLRGAQSKVNDKTISGIYRPDDSEFELPTLNASDYQQ